MTIRLSNTEQETVLAILRTLLDDPDNQPDHPLEWDGEQWR